MEATPHTSGDTISTIPTEIIEIVAQKLTVNTDLMMLAHTCKLIHKGCKKELPPDIFAFTKQHYFKFVGAYGTSSQLQYGYDIGLSKEPVSDGGSALLLAAGHGNIDCFQYLHRFIGCDITDKCSIAAAMEGRLVILQYIVTANIPLPSDCCSFAAERGHIDCLKFAHQHGAPLCPRATLGAARNGHIRCLMYAHRNGSGWHQNVAIAATKNGHWRCLLYAVYHGCPLVPRRVAKKARQYGWMVLRSNEVFTIVFGDKLDKTSPRTSYVTLVEK